MAVKANQIWTLYKTNGSQDESNMNSLQKKWQSRRIKHELYKTNGSQFVLTVISFVESSCLIRLDCHLFCREFMFSSPWLPFVLESNMNSLHNKWLSRRFKHELSTKKMAVKTNQTWTLYKRNGCQEESNMNSLQNWFVLPTICFVESSCLIRLDSHLFCREFMFDSSWLPFVL
jgi:hypothetical protein